MERRKLGKRLTVTVKPCVQEQPVRPLWAREYPSRQAMDTGSQMI